MRFQILLASAAALALVGCNSNSSNGDGQSQALEANVDEKSLEEQVMAALEDAPKHGLTKDLFIEGELPSGGAKRDKLLQVARDYASALADGKVDPEKVRDVYTIARPKTEVEAGVAEALSQNKYREWVNSLAPQSDEYRALSNAFVQLVKSTPNLEAANIPATGKVIKPGERDPRVPAIVQNLRAQGYLPPAQQASGGQARQQAQADPQAQANAQSRQGDSQSQQQQQQQQQAAVFTQQISKALAQWQADSGLKSDGIVGPNTVEQLNAGPKDRARKLAIAMERLRWLEREAPATRIDVNTAATFLEYFRDGQKVDQRKVVVGEPGWETPQLGSPIFALVANPDWVVPDSIVEDEISKKSSAWLAQNNFTKKNGRWVQEPGPESALGLVKFAMQNDESIYLHDTPAKALFNQENRHKSHGCVRVENAVQFANMIAQQTGISDKFSQAMDKDEETQVELPSKIPVRLMYHTAYLGTDGRVKFAQDVYGWDNDVATALGYETRQAQRVQHRSGQDVGP